MAGDGTIDGRRREKRKESRAEAPDSARALTMSGLTRDGMAEPVSRDQNSTLEVIRSNTSSDHAPSHTDQHRGGHTLPSSRAFLVLVPTAARPTAKYGRLSAAAWLDVERHDSESSVFSISWGSS